jgi:hypothetical protein
MYRERIYIHYSLFSRKGGKNMRKGFLLGGALCALLMATVPVQANITVFLDNPSAGPLSGNDLVSGWAFALVDGSPVDVTVTARIDGVNQNEVLCCSERADVQDANPGAPLETGFASLIPYGELAAGPHTIGVEITAAGCDPVIIDRSVVVVKPGGTNFIQSMDFSGANFAATGDGFDADGVGVTSADGTTENDLDVAFSSSSQALLITGPAPDNARLFEANLNPQQEAPSLNGFKAEGIAEITYTPAAEGGGELEYRVEVTDLTGTLMVIETPDGPISAAHIHNAAAGQNGDIIIPLEPIDSAPSGPPYVWEGSGAIDQTMADALFAGELYVNVHTMEYPGGELRGQIVADAQNCQDPSRTVYAGVGRGGVPGPGPGANGMPTTDGCRQFTDEASCGTAWQVNPFGVSAQCVWFPDSSACGACGGALENDGVCINTCW